ncbi:MAG TPA: Fe-S protein assembly co-chaperone HscB [Polyangia bacterium]|nr:Fe-S protein assembly co-chaperone HscB [Polyangia bacterium]
MICWSCEKEGGKGPLCVSCKAILPPDTGDDRFAVLGLPRKFEVDVAAAESAYKDLSRQLHPDRFAKADPRARKAALARTVELNDAWRTIKDPVKRAEYLLELAGFGLQGEDRKPGADMAPTKKVAAPPAFLVEILELREELGEAQQAGDAVKVAFMAAEMRGRAAQAMKTIGAALESGRFEEGARGLIALRYYQRFLDEVAAHEERALSGGDHG